MAHIVLTRWLGLPVFLTVATLGAAACALGGRPVLSRGEIAELWQEPTDLERRDLMYGPGGRGLAPDAKASYTMLEVDTKGFSPGYDVRDDEGRKWSVKLGPEAQTEVVASRLLWAAGYHQPTVYYVPRWTLSDKGKTTVQSGSRFRLESDRKNAGEWSWRNNPFIGTRPFEGLFVLMVMINNWDLKSSQNTVYRVQADGDDARNIYVVKDLGASFGRTNWLFPGTRNDPDGFEREPFVRRVEGNRVEFYYQGGWREPHVTAGAAPADVRWISDLLARLSPQQLNDAFRAGGYGEADSARFLKRLREKIAEGQKIG